MIQPTADFVSSPELSSRSQEADTEAATARMPPDPSDPPQMVVQGLAANLANPCTFVAINSVSCNDLASQFGFD